MRFAVNCKDFNPRPPWGGRQKPETLATLPPSISIHALRGEGDLRLSLIKKSESRISIHALRGEGDVGQQKCKVQQRIFQSTPSVGRATMTGTQIFSPVNNFNPRPPWGGRQIVQGYRFPNIIISIHALRGEGDSAYLRLLLPFRGHFNPRPPWGGRRQSLRAQRNPSIFQSTPSVGRATKMLPRYSDMATRISIHALRGEGDQEEFGKRLKKLISIHALRGEGDARVGLRERMGSHFNPRPPWGGRPQHSGKDLGLLNHFNPRPPWGGRLSMQFSAS